LTKIIEYDNILIYKWFYVLFLVVKLGNQLTIRAELSPPTWFSCMSKYIRQVDVFFTNQIGALEPLFLYKKYIPSSSRYTQRKKLKYISD
jgi:hypothetical protein